MKKTFIEKSEVKNKTVFATNNLQSVLTQRYDSVNSNVKEYKVYTVFKAGMGQYKFLDKLKAEKFAMNYKKIEKQFTTTTTYIYNGMKFASEQELNNWIINNRKY